MKDAVNLILSNHLAAVVPFEVGIDFDDDEVCTANTAANTCEFLGTTGAVTGGGGILGFSIAYKQT